jgi:AmmeMemoRadiSam system protein A
MTSESDRRVLLHIARRAIVVHVNGASTFPEDDVFDGGLDARTAGVFVTLHKDGELRGCIGHIVPDAPLHDSVARCAVAACSSDPRFSPVSADELSHVHIELSVLGPLEPIAGPLDVEIGLHGLLVEKGRRRGLLLPQVATEWKWDREQFLAQTCHKAGLALDAWKNGAKLWRFEAEVFGES